MTEQEMTKAHIKQLVIDMSEALEHDEWERLSDLSSTMRLLAVKQMMDEPSHKAARYGKR